MLQEHTVAASQGNRWRIRDSEDLLWRTWGNESLLFDSKSGDTHLLDEVARQGLLCLQEQPLVADELKHRLAERLDVDPDEELAAYVTFLLQRFDALGLVEGDS